MEDQVDKNTTEALSSLTNTSLDGKIDALITKKDSEGFGHCIKCGYARKNVSNVRNHIESRHLNNSVLCPQCDLTSVTRHALTMHFSRKHPDWEVISQHSERYYQFGFQIGFQGRYVRQFVIS